MSLQYFESQNLNIECINLSCSTINGLPPGGGGGLTNIETGFLDPDGLNPTIRMGVISGLGGQVNIWQDGDVLNPFNSSAILELGQIKCGGGIQVGSKQQPSNLTLDGALVINQDGVGTGQSTLTATTGNLLSVSGGITTTGDITCNTLNYSSLNPPVSAPTPALSAVLTAGNTLSSGQFIDATGLGATAIDATGSDIIAQNIQVEKITPLGAPIITNLTLDGGLTLQTGGNYRVEFEDEIRIGKGLTDYITSDSSSNLILSAPNYVSVTSTDMYVNTLHYNALEPAVGGFQFIVQDNPPFIPENDNTYLAKSNSNLYNWETTEYPVPSPRLVPSYSGMSYFVNDLTELNNAIASVNDGDIILVNNTIDLLGGSITISKGIRLCATNPSVKITTSQTEGAGVIFSGDNSLVEEIIIESTGTGSTATALSFSSATATKNYVRNATIQTNEFGLSTNNIEIQCQNVQFLFVGTPDSHRYVWLQRTTGETLFLNCSFAGNGAPSPNTQCFYSASPASNFIGGKLVISGCSGAVVQRLMIWETSLAGTGIEFFLVNNNFTTTSGMCIFYGTDAFNGISTLYAKDNTEIYGGATPPAGKGLFGADAGSAGTLGIIGQVLAENNTLADLRVDWTDWSSDNSKTVAFNTSIFSPPPQPVIPVLPTSTSGWQIVGNVAGLPSSITAVDATFTDSGAGTILIDPNTVKGVEVQDNNGIVKVVNSNGSYSQLESTKGKILHSGLSQADSYLQLTDGTNTTDIYIGNSLPVHSASVGSMFILNNSTPALYLRSSVGWSQVGGGSAPVQRVLSVGKDENASGIFSFGSPIQIQWNLQQFEQNSIDYFRWNLPPLGASSIRILQTGMYLIQASLAITYPTDLPTDASFQLMVRRYNSSGTLIDDLRDASIITPLPTGASVNYFTLSVSKYKPLNKNDYIEVWVQNNSANTSQILGTSAFADMTYFMISIVA